MPRNSDGPLKLAYLAEARPIVWTCRAKAGADHQQNTDTQYARVYYPLHPLAGQTLRIGKRRRGPSPTYYLVTPTGEGFSLPVWMTEPSAAKLRHEDGPRLQLRALIEIVGLTSKRYLSTSSL